MGSQFNHAQTLHATLCEIERGLFQVAYRVEGVSLGQHPLPRYQVGSCAADAQLRVEQQARECGYAVVVWEAEFTQPALIRSAAGEGVRLNP